MATRKPLGLEDLTEEQIRHVARLEAGEDDGTAGTRLRPRVKTPLEKVVPIRMSDNQWTVLTREAEELGVRPTTLMRMWVLERLREAERGHRGAARRGAVDAHAGASAVAHERPTAPPPDPGTLSLAEVLQHADAESFARRLASRMALTVEELMMSSGATERVTNDLTYDVRVGAVTLLMRIFDEELGAAGGLTPPPSVLQRDA
jgi:hypothetical protein